MDELGLIERDSADGMIAVRRVQHDLRLARMSVIAATGSAEIAVAVAVYDASLATPGINAARAMMRSLTGVR